MQILTHIKVLHPDILLQLVPTANDPVTRTMQQKFDDVASVKDFGATGDGSTDDTAANVTEHYSTLQFVNIRNTQSIIFSLQGHT